MECLKYKDSNSWDQATSNNAENPGRWRQVSCRWSILFVEGFGQRLEIREMIELPSPIPLGDSLQTSGKIFKLWSKC